VIETVFGRPAAQPRRQASVLLHFGQIRLWAPSDWKRVLHIKHFRSFRVSTSTVSFNCSCVSITPNPCPRKHRAHLQRLLRLGQKTFIYQLFVPVNNTTF